jgi:membrane peptidoglycan carboxypeptidase
MKYVRDISPRKPKRRLPWPLSKFHRPSISTVLRWVVSTVAIILVAIAITFAVYTKDLANPNSFSALAVPQSTNIYARDGSLLYSIHGEFKRTVIPFSDMNSNVRNASVSVEDKNFYHEGGISYSGIARSIIVDITHLGKSQGASTITQQYVRNSILTRDKTWARKIKEIILSIEVNARYTKDQVLALYLNQIPYGRNAYGIEAGAQAYFGVDAQNLDLAEAAYMAALPQAPSYYNPFGPNRTSLDARKNTVLDDMLAQNYITKQQHDAAEKEVVPFIAPTDDLVAPHFVAYIQNYLATKYGESTLETGGIQVYTTLDPKLQNIAQAVVTAQAAINAKKYNGNNAALVAIDPKTGQILAMVGSKDPNAQSQPAGCTPGSTCTFEPDFNVATSPRQPGSSAKPYVYVTAFDPQFKMAPSTPRFDVVTDFGNDGSGHDYIPHNYSDEEYGPTNIRSALDGSLNIDAVKTLDQIGVGNAVDTMHAAGITAPLSGCGLSLVLGGCEVTLLDHTSGYATFADGGIHNPVTGILKITDSNGNVLEQYQAQPQQVIDPQADYELTDVLTDNNARAYVFGANSPLHFSDRTVAAKTGTTQNFRDGWTLGFTPSLAVGVWVGNNDGVDLKSGSDGVVVAAPIFHTFIEQALAGTPSEAFPVPPGITHVNVDPVSGLLPNQYTATTVSAIFASYSVPTQLDNVHVVYSVPEDPTNPSSPLVNRLYTIIHSEEPDNAAWEDPAQAWLASHGYVLPPAGAVALPTTAPGAGSANSQTVPTPTGGSGSESGASGTGGAANSTNPPSVQITIPSDGTVVSTLPLTVSANVTPSTGNTIAKVEMLIDGTVSQTQTGSAGPYVFDIMQSQPTGPHVVAVQAFDSQGNVGATSITLNFP